MLSAAGNASRYLLNDKIIEVAGEDLLLNGEPSMRFPTMRLETLPNRDSLLYKDLYNIPDVHSICRGTLRYEGWSNIMYALRVLGVFDATAPSASTFKELLLQKLNVSAGASQHEVVSALNGHLGAGGVRGTYRAKSSLHSTRTNVIIKTHVLC